MAAAGAAAVAMWVSTALAAASTAYAAVSARNQAKAQSKQAEQNARNAESAEASRIRELGKKQASAAQAQMASNGLDLNAENTVVDVIEDDISLNSSKDAWTSFFNAKNQSAQYKTDASTYKAQARNATVSGILNTGSTILSGAGQASQMSKASTTTQPVSNIQSNSLTMDTSRLKQNASGWA
jgi:hypothetical protein